MDSIFWFVLAVICFGIALIEDKELREEFKDIRYALCMLFTVIALYYSVMWIAKEWIVWCL